MHAAHQLQRSLCFSGALAGSRPHAPPRLLPQASAQPPHGSDQAAQVQNRQVPRVVPGPLPGTRREQYAEPSQFGASISTLVLGVRV